MRGHLSVIFKSRLLSKCVANSNGVVSIRLLMMSQAASARVEVETFATGQEVLWVKRHSSHFNKYVKKIHKQYWISCGKYSSSVSMTKNNRRTPN